MNLKKIIMLITLIGTQTFAQSRLFVSLPSYTNQLTDIITKSVEGKSSTLVDATYAYQGSFSARDLRNYFFTSEKSELVFTDFVNNPTPTQGDLDYRFLVHYATVDDYVTKLALKPEQTRSQLTLSGVHSFSLGNQSFFVYAALPVVWVTNQLRPTFVNEGTVPGEPDELAHFFSGTLAVDTAGSLQDPLKKSKFYANKKTSTGLSDLRVGGGWYYATGESSSGKLSVGLVIPAGNRAKGNFLFEPLRGNDGHVALEFGLMASRLFYQAEEQKIGITASGNATYFFANHGVRTLGIKGVPWGSYFLLGQKDVAAQPLIPAANILTTTCQVQPGVAMTGNLIAFYENHLIDVALGYGVQMQTEEKVSKGRFAEGMYGIASPGYDTSDSFTTDDIHDRMMNAQFLQHKDLDYVVAQTPTRLHHSLMLSLLREIAVYDDFIVNLAVDAQVLFSQSVLPSAYVVAAAMGVRF